MEIKKYFKNEFKKHVFTLSIPIILLVVGVSLQILISDDIEYSFIVLAIYNVIFIIIFFVLFIIYIRTYKKFCDELNYLNREEIARINNDASKAYSIGKILITNDAILYFGFFKKFVIPISLIDKVRTAETSVTTSGRGIYITTDTKTITLYCKNKKVVIDSPKSYIEGEGDSVRFIIEEVLENYKRNEDKKEKKYLDINSLPESEIFKDYKQTRIFSVLDYILIIPYLLICLVINSQINDFILNNGDFVLKAFYNVGLDKFIIFLEVMLLNITWGLFLIYYIFYYKYRVKGNTITNYCKFIFFLILISINIIFGWNSLYEYEKDTLSDYIYYSKGHYEEYTVN